jgi:hypothetical protein
VLAGPDLAGMEWLGESGEKLRVDGRHLSSFRESFSRRETIITSYYAVSTSPLDCFANARYYLRNVGCCRLPQ